MHRCMSHSYGTAVSHCRVVVCSVRIDDRLCDAAHQTMRHAFPGVPQRTACPRLYVRGSPRHLKQVLQNLLSNACKNTPEGRGGPRRGRAVELEVELLAKKRGGRAAVLEFSVRDHGCGVPALEQRSIFKPYTQVGVKRGTGMARPDSAEDFFVD